MISGVAVCNRLRVIRVDLRVKRPGAGTETRGGSVRAQTVATVHRYVCISAGGHVSRNKARYVCISAGGHVSRNEARNSRVLGYRVSTLVTKLATL